MPSDQTISCFLCGKKAELRYNDYPGYQEPQTFDIYECKSCNSSFSSPRLADTGSLYDDIYRQGDRVPAYKRYWRFADQVKKIKNPLDFLAESEATYWGVRDALRKIDKDKSSVKILEAGSGLGYMTYALNKAGYNAFGIDISEQSVEKAKTNYGDYYFKGDLFEYARINNDLYDVVIATEVIEHLNEPIDFVEALVKLLKPGGQLLLTTPNKSFMPSDLIWVTENPPVHCWWFSEESIKFIADKIKIQCQFIDLRDYYRNNYMGFDKQNFKRNFPQKPTLAENGDVIGYNVKIQRKKPLRTLISKIGPLNKLLTKMMMQFLKMRDASNPDILVCRSRGVILCAVLKKQS